LLAFQRTALFDDLIAPLGELREADDLGLVGIEQAPFGTSKPLQAGVDSLLGRSVLSRTAIGAGREALELGQQLGRIAEKIRDMLPDGALEFLGLDDAARASRRAGTENAILAVAAVVPALRLGCRGLVRAPEHGQATGPTGQQAAQQVVVFGVVAERQGGIAGELCLGALPGLLVDERRHRDGNPLLLRLGLAAGVGVRSLAAGLLGWHMLVAVGIGRAGGDGVSQDVVHRRG
jgi:hypothetical protein